MNAYQPINPRMSCDPAWWMERLQAAVVHAGPIRDTRLPKDLWPLAMVLRALRSGLDELRLLLGDDPESLATFVSKLEAQGPELWGRDREDAFVRLVRESLGRRDWREKDMIDMILEYLRASGPRLPKDLRKSLEALDLAFADANARGRAIRDGLVSEARGGLGGLQWVRHVAPELRRCPGPLGPDSLTWLWETLATVTGCAEELAVPSPDDWVSLPGSELWKDFEAALRKAWGKQGRSFPVKDLEKASLYLMEDMEARDPHHRYFIRFLIENDAAYRRLLKTCYADEKVQRAALEQECERFNRLPEHAAHRVSYDEEEKNWWLKAFFFRPDVVQCFVEREKVKDMYRALGGLDARAYLPRVLHEVQGLFGYVTPEACQNIVERLGLDPEDVLRVIASYKQYSADPSGEIIIYVCKGTACFLRGQPELSRRLTMEIGAEVDVVGRYGVQYVEMDCFGVCHLAPVVRAGNRFYGQQKAEDIPRLVRQLIQGPDYTNRQLFVARLVEKLVSETVSEPIEALKVERVDVFPKTGSGLTVPEAFRDETFSGGAVVLHAEGDVAVERPDGRREDLGRLIPRVLPFKMRDVDGSDRFGAVIYGKNRRLIRGLGLPEMTDESILAAVLPPTVHLVDGLVALITPERTVILGPYTDRLLVVESSQAYLGVVLTGESSGVPYGNDAAVKGESAGHQDPSFRSAQDRVVLGYASAKNPMRMDSYREAGGYESVFRVLGFRGEPPWSPERLIAEVRDARLRGRGGAGFPTGRKWEAMLRAVCRIEPEDGNQDPIKLIVANGDEGDPGAFMDRTLIEQKPHQVLEGMILAAIAVGARYGVIYVRKEYEDAVRSLEDALFEARRCGFLGHNIFGVPGLHFDIEIRLGAGAFVAGEKRAIMRAIEGKPAEPTIKAPSNTVRGLWGKPTLLNNVETFANVPVIIQRGSAWYAGLGTSRSGGTKIFSVAGIVKKTGLVEVRFGKTLADIIEICGGVQDGKKLSGVQIGGPSGAILSLTGARAYLLQTPLDFDTFSDAGAMLGSGGLVFIGEDDDVVRLARHFTDWLAEESCGQCPSCFRGTRALGNVLDRLLAGQGKAADIHELWAMSDVVRSGSQCGLGTTAANPVTSALRFFPAAFFHYLLQNPEMGRRDVFEALEALRLLTRQDLVRVTGVRRHMEGTTFTLKRHLVRFLVEEIEKIDQYRPRSCRMTDRLLRLLGLPRYEVGQREVVMEWRHVA
ncbi:NAD(P)H-dependent oxidoreductase subunit E [Desulfosoma caldarium]|uniref:NADH:ubiquinone oxidoreductase subunit F (NADH-binding) n=1 Tax=Desulfosoma caldarium TaxID=610254 RepID=A0A3N1VM85_9BACT|nr:NAD(P)H-dependent oxidoreductase subunit E [Desulfosoma caldarium]ROR03070.1 NADH:ubiquinone oxidoreductase subunit F (NADH-binding) [Desulfosoma caldarium]